MANDDSAATAAAAPAPAAAAPSTTSAAQPGPSLVASLSSSSSPSNGACAESGEASSSSSSSSDSEASDCEGSDLGFEDVDAEWKVRQAAEERKKMLAEVPRTANEVLNPPVADVSAVSVAADEPLELVGTISSQLDAVVVIKGLELSRPLEEGSILCTQDRKVIGAVAETLGPVQSPFYTVRFGDEAQVAAAGLALRAPVFTPKSRAQFVTRIDELMAEQGSDASSWNDEEVADHERDFSDDEAEMAARKKRKKRKRGGDKPGTPAPSGRPSKTAKPRPRARPAPIIQPGQYGAPRPAHAPQTRHVHGMPGPPPTAANVHPPTPRPTGFGFGYPAPIMSNYVPPAPALAPHVIPMARRMAFGGPPPPSMHPPSMQRQGPMPPPAQQHPTAFPSYVPPPSAYPPQQPR
ncbi:H/ACA ribonucleoprotein complex non-core subunit NAF1 [Thecamonas trahens ATCC 50062]|uniref:H/ACA ribonucleoprotein complex non-core subunit NAF1 n=1 Tax=Thecamonas trahens ATCC 50062 TaxID=461836 RepID=A0A0L0D554_THETB|nr:H/ACA ribonucleoprotein complex non-core subunit NAF1 [Thecamonas trahens ATCC 50062]KNC46433.1 H/ACA ribonucleoprotein complex non-core subunit NAF1 [Thecamonas trahens ATCC 50062]|eukprot:XP_013760724.1 H/ACA ribonucleoprotein complex non-core subunit NAF1 [Thecamonas trahens ATCC 50062]